MTKLIWRGPGAFNYFDSYTNEIAIGEQDVEAGRGPIILAHEITHWRRGPRSEAKDTSLDHFYKELETWRRALASMDPKNYATSENLSYVDNSLEELLEDIETDYGARSEEYKKAKTAYEWFTGFLWR